jgi:hypothetical protein
LDAPLVLQGYRLQGRAFPAPDTQSLASRKEHKMKTCFCKISVLVVMIGWMQPILAQDKDSKGQERIGIYDSRAIAVAFAGSPAHEKQLRQLMAAHKKAKEAGDLETVAKLEAEGKAQQVKAHQQAFSVAPVDDLLLHITNALPEILRTAGVIAIKSKWDEAGLKKHPGAETVDLTMRLVDAFQPNERQRKSALEIQTHKPIPLEQAERIKD